jgi:lysophospholipase L1-like esterase
MSARRSIGVALTLAMAFATAPAPAPALGAPQYVAMGSSYASGPGILPIVPGSPLRCARSAENYAHVLARLRGLSLLDVTCSGATTVDLLHPGQFSLPAQLTAVTSETRLITVTIGGNDVYLMANLRGLSCDRRLLPGVCTVKPDAEVEARFAHLAESLRQVVEGARSRSPNVQIIFVNYFTVLPQHGTCTRVGLTPEAADHMRGIEARLAAITRQVATQTGAGLMDVASLSRTHDACSKDPWVLGARQEEGTMIPPFHPTAAAMTAVGNALNTYISG